MKKQTHNKKFGWIRDLPDHRDVMYSAPVRRAEVPLPAKVNLMKQMPPVYDQGNLGSCTAQAIAAAIDFAHSNNPLRGGFFTPSRLFIYFNEREMEGNVNLDAGASIRDGIKSVADQGVCKETDWPYYVSKFKEKPSKQNYMDALGFQAIDFQRIIHTDLYALRSCLAGGHPFVFGLTLYDSFFDAEHNGNVKMPKLTENMVGGHAMLCVGYVDRTKKFIVRNSWGDKWGAAGYCAIPYAYMTHRQLGADFWTITSAE